jgi:hypothetical protein
MSALGLKASHFEQRLNAAELEHVIVAAELVNASMASLEERANVLLVRESRQKHVRLEASAYRSSNFRKCRWRSRLLIRLFYMDQVQQVRNIGMKVEHSRVCVIHHGLLESVQGRLKSLNFLGTRVKATAVRAVTIRKLLMMTPIAGT